MRVKRFDLRLPTGHWRSFRWMMRGWYHCESCHGAINTYESDDYGDELALLVAHGTLTCRHAPANLVV
jgi:hypothetical protein